MSALPIARIPCLFAALFTPDLSIISIIGSLLTKILAALYPAKDDLKSVSRMDRHKSLSIQVSQAQFSSKVGLQNFFTHTRKCLSEEWQSGRMHRS
jgi:hypothetical protein